ncbi:protein STICHEL-like 3 isoform X2 [Andrographis paniculata]|nr:protein STICHEL-like 3 isoform X2 [Andrographis paniculata]XP_051135372.1 protein STICHEL-like 3 isoform X2 [Andrographis paniculata]
MLKDTDGSISDHLRNHIHLTNCIHLKNHMHKQSPILANRAFMRDLAVLQRSRSLRDPSASPPSRNSPSVVDILLKRGQRDDLISGRLPIGLEHSNERGRMSEDMIHECKRVNREGMSGKSPGYPQDGHVLGQNTVSGNTESGDKHVEFKGGHRQDRRLMTLSDRLKDVITESDDAVPSHNQGNGRHKAGASTHHGNGVSRSKRYRYRGVRRRRPSGAPQQSVAPNEMSVASNSLAQDGASQKYHLEEGFQEQTDQNVKGVPQNGCGIPWNWSRIHDRGKSFIDLAGRSLSCGLSESKLKKGRSASHGMAIPDMALTSELSSSSTKSEREALPLLLDASGSRGSIARLAWGHDYSGELGIFSENLLKQETEYDLPSEGRSDEQHKLQKHHNGRHKNLTQKYMPRTFRDLVGQNLVVQALSNAIAKRKIGSLYLFFGPHGTGKTSCARIFARALNCQSQENPKPCGACNSCIAQIAGKTKNVKEIGPVGNNDFESILKRFSKAVTSQRRSQYKILIFDACDTLSSEHWKAMLKVFDQAPRRVVFILICSTLEALPHLIISRCQKFFFPKLKDADIIYTLQWIATKEDLEIDKDALKLITSRSDGSLRDAEMTLEQLSLLGKRISLDLVQELAGLISDEKLIDLLDLAFSADTANTVKNLRDIMESGIDPLALMSQLAAVITDILAGIHDFIKDCPRRKFFRKQELSKEDMEKLRQALKTLSEAEKQLRGSNDRITWLTAAVLQLAPDQQYLLAPSSSEDTNFNQRPLVLNNALIERPRKSNSERSMFPAGSSGSGHYNGILKGTDVVRSTGNGGGTVSQQFYLPSNDRDPISKVHFRGQEIEGIWLEVLEKIPHTSVKEFLATEGKLISINYDTDPTVQLLFNSELAKSEAERFKTYISQAFELVLRSPVHIEIRCNSRNRGEIVEISEKTERDRRNIGNLIGVTSTTLPNVSNLNYERNQSLSLVRSRLPLARIIQQQEESSEHSGWSKNKAVSIAEKLEQENLRLEPRSRSLLRLTPSKGTRRKLSRLKIRTKKPRALLKLVSCGGRCLSRRSPR